MPNALRARLGSARGHQETDQQLFQFLRRHDTRDGYEKDFFDKAQTPPLDEIRS